MDADLRNLALRRAVAAWDYPGDVMELDPDGVDLDTDRLFERAVGCVEGSRHRLSPDADTMLIVAKSPHAGSFDSIVDVAARCLAFGLEVGSVHTLEPEAALEVAHALYPDVWINYVRPPVGKRYWSRLASLFDSPKFVELFGAPFDSSMVKEGQRVCEDNHLTMAEFAAVWEQGRLPISRDHIRRAFGERALEMIFGRDDARGEFDWYRSSLPFGIQKVASSVMAFALRDERLYDGAPTVILNGQFALLSRLFEYPDHGAVVLEVGLPGYRSAVEFRRLLVGHSDVPSDCCPGSIRRDAADGFFILDDPSPVTPWANVVHASDGYLSGTIEAHRLLPRSGSSRLRGVLRGEGYTKYEIDKVLIEDPMVISADGELRLTRLTKGEDFDACVAGIRRWFPSLAAMNGGQVGDAPLRALVDLAGGTAPNFRLDRVVPAPRDGPPRAIEHRDGISIEITLLGRDALQRGSLGCLVPFAGGGGRFGGYEQIEGSASRLKSLAPLFWVEERKVSALDVRASHLRHLASRNLPVSVFLSCNHLTEVPVMAWADDYADLAPSVGRVPELYRVRVPSEDLSFYGDRWAVLSNLLRSSVGEPLVKPVGSMGLLWSFFSSGALERWIDQGVEFVVAANADDVGFRIDPAIVGVLAADSDLEAVVLTTSSPIVAPPRAPPTKGGIVRDWLTASGASSRYVLENADISGSALNTNQIYMRSTSLLHRLRELRSGSFGQLPYYLEAKRTRTGDGDVVAWHVYQPYCEVLRVMEKVDAYEMHRTPTPGQPGAFQPLKTPDDVAQAQHVLDRLGAISNESSTDGGGW